MTRARGSPPADPAGGGERDLWLTVVCLWLVAVFTLIVGYRGAVRSVDAFLPVSVEVTARAGAEVPALRLLALGPFRSNPSYELEPGRFWRITARPVSALGLALPEGWRDWLGGVEIAVGPRRQRFDAAALALSWRRGDAAAGEREVRWAPTASLANDGMVSRRLPALNGPDDGDVSFRLFALPAIFLAALLLFAARRRPWVVALGAGAPADPTRVSSAPTTVLMARIWAAFGAGVVVAALVLLERLDAFYFVQDDNMVQFLPLALEGCATLNQGHWPDYDVYQLLGQPMATAGIYGLSYPVLWTACGIADSALDLPTATFEVYAALHLVPGFLACFQLGRDEGLTPPLATALGLSFALAGFFLIGGRSWVYMLPVALWLPVLLLSARRLAATARPFRWLAGSGLAIGLFFHAGNAQMWCYGVLAWALTVTLAWLGGALPRRRLIWAAAALVFGLAVAMPLLLPQFRFVAGLARDAAEGNGIWNQMAALVLPYPLVDVGHPNGWGASSPGSMSPFFYAGTLLTAAGALALVAALATMLRRHLEPDFWWRQRWSTLTLLALLLAIGQPALLWSALGALPAFEHFTHPFKLLPYLLLGLNLSGALALQRLLPRQRRWHTGLALATALLMLWNTGLARTSFFTYADDPYPPLPPAIAALLRPAGSDTLQPRLLAAARFHTHAAGFATSLMHNLPTAHRVMALDGYGSLTGFSAENGLALGRMWREPEAARRAYGVRWLLRYDPPRLPDQPTGLGQPYGAPFAQAYMRAFRSAPVAARAGALTLYDLGPADPLAFYADDPGTALPARAVDGALEVTLPAPASPRRVVLNFLKRPASRLSADGAPLALESDAWGRVVAEVPAGTRRLVLDHGAGWGRGLYAGVVLVLVALALLVVAVRRDPDFFPAPGRSRA